MRTMIITLLTLLIVTNCLSLGCNKLSTDTSENDILTKTYVSQYYGYSLDYSANWDVFEWQNCTYFVPTGDFSMLIVICASMHDKLNTEPLNQLLWLDDLRTIDQSTNEILFTGIYGEIRVTGREIKKEMEDRQLIFTAIYSEDLPLHNGSDMPYEIELSINSLRYMEPTRASIPPFVWENPPLAVDIKEMINSYFNSCISFSLFNLPQGGTTKSNYTAHMPCFTQSPYFHVHIHYLSIQVITLYVNISSLSNSGRKYLVLSSKSLPETILAFVTNKSRGYDKESYLHSHNNILPFSLKIGTGSVK